MRSHCYGGGYYYDSILRMEYECRKYMCFFMAGILCLHWCSVKIEVNGKGNGTREGLHYACLVRHFVPFVMLMTNIKL